MSDGLALVLFVRQACPRRLRHETDQKHNKVRAVFRVLTRLRGEHYCKLLSPAMTMEWMMTDSFEVLTIVRKLAKKEHSADFPQLSLRASRQSGARAGEDPFVKVKGLTTDLINQLQAEASSDANPQGRWR